MIKEVLVFKDLTSTYALLSYLAENLYVSNGRDLSHCYGEMIKEGLQNVVSEGDGDHCVACGRDKRRAVECSQRR